MIPSRCARDANNFPALATRPGPRWGSRPACRRPPAARTRPVSAADSAPIIVAGADERRGFGTEVARVDDFVRADKCLRRLTVGSSSGLTPVPGCPYPGRIRRIPAVSCCLASRDALLLAMSTWRARSTQSSPKYQQFSRSPRKWRDSREQAHLPAEQPSPSEDPWVPAADAHPCGSRHPGRPSSQGPRRAVGLTSLTAPTPADPTGHHASRW